MNIRGKGWYQESWFRKESILMRRKTMNKKLKTIVKHCVYLFLAGCILGAAVQPLSAQVTIPQGSIINSAVFHVYVTTATNRSVTLHRITANWAETFVTYANFGNSYAMASEGGFTTNTIGWKEVNLLNLVQLWALGPMAGGYDNFGIAMVELEPSDNVPTTYWSSDYISDPTLRPKLVIGYTPPGGSLTYMTIQRPGGTAEYVVDSWLNPLEAALNYGTSPELVTRHYGVNYKYSLVRFNFTITPSCPGTGTPGYWMNHPEAWPEDYDHILIGEISYEKEVAIEFMKMAVAGDKTYTMFPALVAAKLNAAIGCATVCPNVNIASTIIAADAWMAMYPIGSGVAAGGKNSPWRVGEPLYFLLDQYNNGLLCVPHRD
ncbi:MAG: DNRLRE domain-containing protein [Syntrophobacterales bacterium]|nr:MAG: DNRLRE domain-containing protein [Syntrophobacterales bacterium]